MLPFYRHAAKRLRHGSSRYDLLHAALADAFAFGDFAGGKLAFKGGHNAFDALGFVHGGQAVDVGSVFAVAGAEIEQEVGAALVSLGCRLVRLPSRSGAVSLRCR